MDAPQRTLVLGRIAVDVRANHPAIFRCADCMTAQSCPIQPAMGLMHGPISRQITRNHRCLMAQSIDVVLQHEPKAIAGFAQDSVCPDIAGGGLWGGPQEIEILWRTFGGNVNQGCANTAKTTHKRIDDALYQGRSNASIYCIATRHQNQCPGFGRLGLCGRDYSMIHVPHSVAAIRTGVFCRVDGAMVSRVERF